MIRLGTDHDPMAGWAREPRLTPLFTMPHRRTAPRRGVVIASHAGAFLVGLIAGAAALVALLARGLA